MIRNLPRELTTYDLLKTAAVLLMLVDHVGHHFFPFSVDNPEHVWFRIIGRFCVPMWFFLVGYARTTEISKTLVAGAVIILASAAVSGQYLLPLNILFSIGLLRYLRHATAIRAFGSAEGLRGIFLILLFLAYPTAAVFEYGTLGMLFVLVGYAVRNWEIVSAQVKPVYLRLFAVLSFFVFFLYQGIFLPHLLLPHAAVLMAGGAVIGLILWNFKGMPLPNLTQRLPNFLVFPLRIMGRYTLEIYVLHILFFRAICMVWYPDLYGFMEWKWVPMGLISAFV